MNRSGLVALLLRLAFSAIQAQEMGQPAVNQDICIATDWRCEVHVPGAMLIGSIWIKHVLEL